MFFKTRENFDDAKEIQRVSIYYQRSDAKMLYFQHYYNAYNYFITCMKGGSNQPDFHLHSRMCSLLSKSRNGLLYQEKYNILDVIYRDDFNASSTEVQVKALPKFIAVSDFLLLRFKCLQSVS